MGRSKVSDTVFRRCRLQWAILSRPACINIVIGGASSRRFARRSLCCCRSLIMAADRARCSVRAHARSHGGGAARRVDRVRRRDVLGARDSDRAGICPLRHALRARPPEDVQPLMPAGRPEIPARDGLVPALDGEGLCREPRALRAALRAGRRRAARRRADARDARYVCQIPQGLKTVPVSAPPLLETKLVVSPQQETISPVRSQVLRAHSQAASPLFFTDFALSPRSRARPPRPCSRRAASACSTGAASGRSAATRPASAARAPAPSSRTSSRARRIGGASSRMPRNRHRAASVAHTIRARAAAHTGAARGRRPRARAHASPRAFRGASW